MHERLIGRLPAFPTHDRSTRTADRCRRGVPSRGPLPRFAGVARTAVVSDGLPNLGCRGLVELIDDDSGGVLVFAFAGATASCFG